MVTVELPGEGTHSMNMKMGIQAANLGNFVTGPDGNVPE